MELIDQGTSARILLDRTEPFFQKKKTILSSHFIQASGPGRDGSQPCRAMQAPALVSGEW
jgi:hypothetical protein